MKFIFSLILILFLSSANISAADTTAETTDKLLNDFIDSNTNKFDSTFNNDEQLNEFLKKNKISRKHLDLIKKKQEKKFDIQKLKPFIFLALIIFFVISSLNSETIENTTKPKKSKNNNQSRIDEFIKKSNKKNIDKEREDEFSYDDDYKEYEDEAAWDAAGIGDLKIKVEEKIDENRPFYFISGIGNLNFKDKDFKLIEKENDQAKFTVYAFDITDNEKEVALQGLTDPYKDENYILSSTRNMESKPGYGYTDWTPIFIFPKSLVIPPYRGERKIKFVVSATKINAKFEKGKIVNNKDFYFSTEAILNLNFQEPGYLEEDQYEDEVNEKIVQLGLAVAYSEKKINQRGVEAIKTWINQKVIWKHYFAENTEEENENKIKYSFLLNNTYELLKNKKLSLSEIVKELNYKSNISKRYDAMNLLLNIAGSDDRLSAEEDKLLNKTARALELDMDRFQQMKTSTIANIDTIDDTDETSEDTIFNFSADMTNEEKCKKLRLEYTRWNRQTNNSNEKIRNQAKKMVELTASLRKKYNC